MDNLTQKIKQIIEDYKLLVPNDRILVCVSGGSDSIFLLYLLSALKDEYKLKLHIAHVNHSLRAQESDKDCEFVRNLAAKLNIPFFSTKVDTKEFVKAQKLSLEDAARRLRYNFFLKVAHLYHLDKIALAHTKNDQAETILMRLVRGTGLTGLCGIRHKRSLEDKILIRPLLDISKEEILKFLRKNKIKSRIDSSNLKCDYFRNKIRLKILPLLEEYNPKIKDKLFNLGQNLKEVEDYLQEKVENIYKRLVTKANDKRARLKRGGFLKLEPALRKALIRRIIEVLKGNLKKIDYKHIQAIDKFIKKDAIKGRGIELPKNLQVKKERDAVIFLEKEKSHKKKIKIAVYKLRLNQELKISMLRYSFLACGKKKNVNLKRHSKFLEYFDFDKIKFPLVVRTRKEGDIFRPLGAKGKKKLKKFFIDEKVDINLRNRLPLIFSGKRIVWVVGMRISDDFKVSPQTKRLLKIQARKISPIL